MRFQQYLPIYTASDYRQWEGDWELIDGYPYAMSPSAVFGHQRLSSVLLRQVGNWLDKNGTGCNNCREVYDLDWHINDTTIIRPDIAIICHQHQGDFITKPPVLVIEILSPSTALKDRNVKYQIYEEQGVKYYILADPSSKTYSVFELQDGKYAELPKATTQFKIEEGCEITIDVEAALAQIKHWIIPKAVTSNHVSRFLPLAEKRWLDCNAS